VPASEIIARLYIGAQADVPYFASQRDVVIVCVRNRWPEEEPINALWVPVVGVNDHSHQQHIFGLPKNLDLVAQLIHDWRTVGYTVLVHCKEGVERSPLAVAWYLMKHHSLTMAQAYLVVCQKRHGVEDRRHWVGV
jgi:protein-tyrosine phosphatase